MTRLGWFECLILVAFFLSGLAAFLTGGLVWLGYVAQVFMWTSFCWLARVVYVEFRDELIEEYQKNKAFQEWGKRSRMKGME
jgi:hypothetical protein